MRTASRVLLVATVALGLVALAVAGEAAKGEKSKDEKAVTVSGTLVCAKCTLKKEGMTDCQSVLQADGKEYYIVKNEVAKEHHVCHGTKDATVTGSVAEKEGTIWLTPEKIEIAEAKD